MKSRPLLILAFVLLSGCAKAGAPSSAKPAVAAMSAGAASTATATAP